MTAGEGPQFLVIGAQKCGTTTLYEDLRSHPQIHIPDKESSRLLGPELATAEGCKRYRAAFGAHPDGHVAGEVSAEYAKLPEIEVVSVARQVMETVKVIYIVRDPVARVISHHHHDLSAGLVPADINRAVREHPRLLDNSRYATQIRGWIEAFGRESVYVIRFEDYMADRVSGAAAVQRFLGVPERPPAAPEVAFNTSDAKRVANGLWRRFWATPLYQRVLRPKLPESVRQRAVQVALPKPPERPPGPSAQTRAWLIQELAPEVAALAELLGTQLWWDLRSIHASSSDGAVRRNR